MSQKIGSHLKEERVFEPNEAVQKRAHIKSVEEYERIYRRSIEEPEAFWAEQAKKHVDWFSDWESVVECDFTSIGAKEGPYVSFFKGATLNVSYNCLDRHANGERAAKRAIIWQSEDGSEERIYTYKELHRAVSRFAAALNAQGVEKGSAVTIYLPMIPELPIAMLACARLGAIHSVVFSAFSAEALHNRIGDCSSEVLITADVGYHAGKTVELKKKADHAVDESPSISKIIVFDRGGSNPPMKEGRDVWWHDAIAQVGENAQCDPVPVDAEDPLFILYTSGSTGKPKGVLHTSGGYLLWTHMTTRYVFDLQDDDIFWCTADCGWITGHSYLTYGPLSNGATAVMFEGTPTYPEPDRFWKVVEQYGVTIFYTAPTALRSLMRLGDSWPNKCDLSSLRILGTVGEPINPEAWMWYYRTIGKERCPIVDTWWQTETGGIMLTTLPGAHAAKPGAAGFPFFGVQPEILKDKDTPTEVNEGGSLVIRQPWPGMIRGVYGDKKNELIKNVYFSQFPGSYFPADGCRRDEDGYYWLLGRIDDVINVSAHRFSTAEIESALVGHRSVAEAAVVPYPHERTGQAIYCYVTLKQGEEPSDDLKKALVEEVREEIGPIATPGHIHFTPALPKTRSGKIMRRILRKIAEGQPEAVGDVSTLADPSVVDDLIAGAHK